MPSSNAKTIPCKRIFDPADPAYDESIRRFQGCPTIAVTRGGRIFLGWYAGGLCEPHMDNYSLLIYSDDGGKTWSKPVFVIPSDKENLIHALDIQLRTAPDGSLQVYWTQNNVEPDDGREIVPVYGKPVVSRYGYIFNDMEHAEWRMICRDPDAETLVFDEPECLDKGFLRCKPLVLHDGTQINFNYDQTVDRYGYSISKDGGRTFTHAYGARKIKTNFDETMAYEMRDGTIRMFARSWIGELVESLSFDGGNTWTDARPSGITAPDTRFYVSRLSSGRVLLIASDAPKIRSRLTAYLSEDDGANWKYKKLIDPRDNISYPDADEHDGRIFLTYDRDRMGEKEILFTSFTEADIMDGDFACDIGIVSKPAP